MKLKCLGSGSSGNCYILENSTEALIIEAGVRFKDVKIALDFDVGKVVGVLVSHIHKDHSASAGDFEKIGIPVFKPYESDMERQVRRYGNFVVKSFPLVHDVPCFGFLVVHPEMGRLLYASDTEYIRYKFRGLNHIFVESNHDKNMLDESKPQYFHQITGHMEISTALDFLNANKSVELRNVILLHLSQEYSSESVFLKEASKVTGVNCFIANKGLEVVLNKAPF